MARKVIPKSQIREWMNVEIRKIPKLESVEIGGINILVSPEEGQCNWVPSNYHKKGNDADLFDSAFARILLEAQRTFDAE